MINFSIDPQLNWQKKIDSSFKKFKYFNKIFAL